MVYEKRMREGNRNVLFNESIASIVDIDVQVCSVVGIILTRENRNSLWKKEALLLPLRTPHTLVLASDRNWAWSVRRRSLNG